jgi:hypothetical protein
MERSVIKTSKPMSGDRARPRRGVSSIEVLVAFTLLAGIMTISTSLLVKQGRMLQAQREYRLALDELSNQMERLTVLPEDALREAVDSLKPSSTIAERLSGVQLRGELQPAEIGQRVTLRIWWDEPQRSAAPLRLTAWVLPRTATDERPTAGDDPS